MTIEVHPATAARSADAAAILAPKKADEPGCWCLTYRLRWARAELPRLIHSRTIPEVDDTPVWSVIRSDYRGHGPSDSTACGPQRRSPVAPSAG